MPSPWLEIWDWDNPVESTGEKDHEAQFPIKPMLKDKIEFFF
jgi:hypothetical protein